MEYYNQKYNISLRLADFDNFTTYWTLTEKMYIKFSNLKISSVFQLAIDVGQLADFSMRSLDAILFSIGKSVADYELSFSDRINNSSKSYLFIELCHLWSGFHTQTRLDWHELSSTFTAPNTTTAIEVAIDPLYPDWLLQRIVTYNPTFNFPTEQYVLNPATNIYEAQYRFMAEFMLIF